MVRFTEAGPKKKNCPPGSQSLSHTASGGSALFCCGRSPASSSSGPVERPGSSNSVPLVQSVPKVSPVQSLPPSG